MSFNDRKNSIIDIQNYSQRLIEKNQNQASSEVMREETELILEKEKTIFTILSIITLVTIIITIKIIQT